MILDLFAGPGGWDEGLASLGVRDVVGVEYDDKTTATRLAAGHETVHGDIRTIPTGAFSDVSGLIASPPCQTFSDAGPGSGKASIANLAVAAADVLDGAPVAGAVATSGLDAADPRSALVLEPLRFVRDHQPAWLAFENVPPVLPVWQTYAERLHSFGYSTWAGILNAANYGVPQSRKRAFLLASQRPLRLPEPTHSKRPGGDATLFGDLLPWVTMAEALGWDSPPPDDLTAWAWRRPATTVVRSFRPEIISAPGYRMAGDGPRQNTPGSIEVTPEQLCVLQSVRTDYPFQGARTKRLSLIGAILPPPWAAAILRPLIESNGTAVAA